MKIIKIFDLDEHKLIDPTIIKKCQKGRPTDWKRFFVLRNLTDNKIAIVSLNIFERMAYALKKVFCRQCYTKFEMVFKTKNVKVISLSELKQTEENDHVNLRTHQLNRGIVLKKPKPIKSEENNKEVPTYPNNSDVINKLHEISIPLPVTNFTIQEETASPSEDHIDQETNEPETELLEEGEDKSSENKQIDKLIEDQNLLPLPVTEDQSIKNEETAIQPGQQTLQESEIETEVLSEPRQIHNKEDFLKENALAFLNTTEKVNIDITLYLGIITHRILKNFEFNQDPLKHLKKLMLESDEGAMAYEFFTHSIELEKLHSHGLISDNVMKELLKHAIVKENALAFLNTTENTNLDNILYLGIITNRILIDFEFNQNPLKHLKKLKFECEEGAMAYEFFTSSIELEKLHVHGIISSKVMQELLKHAILKENALAFIPTETASFDHTLYMGIITNRVLMDFEFNQDPLRHLKKLKLESDEGAMAYKFFTNSNELEKLHDRGIISSHVMEALKKNAIKKV